MKKSWKKKVSGCISVPVKEIWKFSRTVGLPYPCLLKVKNFHLHPTCLLYMRVDYFSTYNTSKSKWHMACVFLLYVKIIMLSTFIYTINLLKPYLFQNSNDTGCSVGLRYPIKSIFEPEEDLNCFDTFMLLLTQNRIYEIISMS